MLGHNQHPGNGRRTTDAGNQRADQQPEANFQLTHGDQIGRQHDQGRDDDDGLRNGEFEESEVAHIKPTFLRPSKSGESKLGTIQSKSRRG